MKRMIREHLFNEPKAVQSAAVLLSSHPNSRFEYMRLLKLLYIANRESLKERHRFLFVDRVTAMKHGPVLSRVYNLIQSEDVGLPEWQKYFRTDAYDIELVKNPGVNLLSRYEVGKLKEVSERYRTFDVWTLSDLTHQYVEWIDAWSKRENRWAVDVEWRSVGNAVGLNEKDIELAVSEACFEASVNPFEVVGRS